MAFKLSTPPYPCTCPAVRRRESHVGRQGLHIFGHARSTAASRIPSPYVFLTEDTEISGDTA